MAAPEHHVGSPADSGRVSPAKQEQIRLPLLGAAGDLHAGHAVPPENLGGRIDLTGHRRPLRIRPGRRLTNPHHCQLGPGKDGELFPDAEGVISLR